MKALILTGVLLFSCVASAQTDQATDNLVYTSVNPAPQGTNIGSSWTGFSVVTSTGGNTTSDNGAVTGYNMNTGTFMFGYNPGTIAYTYAINQALAHSGSGVQVRGYNYSWEINNLNYDNRQGSIDTLTARITTFDPSGVARRIDSWTYDTKFDWTTFSGTVNYNTPGDPSEFGNMRIEFSGRDTGFWAGYYGPMVRNIDVSLRYGVDPCVTDPQSSPTCSGYRTYYNMTDDGFAQVNLPFAFPFYGQVFATSYMYTNGVVGFLDNNWGFCCDGTDLNGQVYAANSPWRYAIYALNTDLYPGQQSRFYTQETDNGTGIKYTWENVVEIGTNNENTFHVQIKDTGFIGIAYDQVNLTNNRQPLIGIAGDISLGQYDQKFFNTASNLPQINLTTPQSSGWRYEFSGTETTDICAFNPLHNTSCAGYQQAYLNQQCTISALYDSTCPGYAQAYHDQQCSINALYATTCPGYAQAYHDQQCSINALYATTCPGYAQAYFDQQCTANALYDSACPGYQQAYFDQQCGLDPLYNTTCAGYEQAYFDQQCSANALYDNQCPGYAAAYFNQQCSLDPLYNQSCLGYQQAYYSLQCSISPLWDSGCPGYQQAYYDQQCTANPLYDSGCANYDIVSAATQPPASEDTAVTVVAQADTTAAASPTEPTAATSPTSPTSVSPAAVVSTVRPIAPAAAPAPSVRTQSAENARQETRAAEQKQEQKKTDRAVARAVPRGTTGQAAQKAAADKAKEAVADAAAATTIEAQQAAQSLVLGLMGYNPAFSAYQNSIVPDTNAAVMARQYNQPTVDNRRALRALSGASDRMHQDMVDQQYGRMP